MVKNALLHFLAMLAKIYLFMFFSCYLQKLGIWYFERQKTTFPNQISWDWGKVIVLLSKLQLLLEELQIRIEQFRLPQFNQPWAAGFMESQTHNKDRYFSWSKSYYAPSTGLIISLDNLELFIDFCTFNLGFISWRFSVQFTRISLLQNAGFGLF